MTAAVQTSWQVSGSIQMVVHEQKKCNNFDVRPRPWGKRPVNLPCFWQCVVDLCIALVIWVQLVAICIRWSASVANRVTGFFTISRSQLSFYRNRSKQVRRSHMLRSFVAVSHFVIFLPWCFCAFCIVEKHPIQVRKGLKTGH